MGKHLHQRFGNGPTIDGAHSRVYDFVARRLMRRVYRRIADEIETVAPQRSAVLDVGTGPGVLLMELAKRRPDLTLTGIDLAEDMITAARRNLGTRADLRAADVTDLPFEDDAFDLIVSSYSLHHWEDPAAAVPELARVLRPAGQIYLYDFGFADFATVDSTADTLFTGAPIQHLPFRTGMPIPNKAFRHVLTAAA